MENSEVPEDFKKIIKEFCGDILISFPDETTESIKLMYNGADYDYNMIFEHCKKIYPERFFDILYQNEEIFDNEELDLHFLPGVDFKKLW